MSSRTPSSAPSAPADVAVLGLGAMGSRMAQRLASTGLRVVTWNRTRPLESAQPVLESPAEAARAARVVLTVLADDEAARAVWMGAHGLAAALAPDQLALDSSTLSPSCAVDLEVAVRAGGGVFLEAPVVGSRPQAEAGQLIHLLGGAPAAVERAAPILDAMGSQRHHVGPVGAAAHAKLAVNAFFAAQVAALAESLALLGATDLGPTEAAELLAGLPVTSPPLAGAARAMAREAFAPQFPVRLVEKDLRYALAATETLGRTSPVTRAVAERFGEARAAGWGEDNLTGVARLK